MRTRVRVIFSLWVSIATAVVAGVAHEFLAAEPMIWFAAGLLVIEAAALFAIWRTQATFRKLMHWLSGGPWPREGDAS